LWGVPVGWTIAWIVRSVVTTLRLRSGDWERRRLVA
jgi:Na+-driven multidrug efflux pump